VHIFGCRRRALLDKKDFTVANNSHTGAGGFFFLVYQHGLAGQKERMDGCCREDCVVGRAADGSI
jgi:hypothetical protein